MPKIDAILTEKGHIFIAKFWRLEYFVISLDKPTKICHKNLTENLFAKNVPQLTNTYRLGQIYAISGQFCEILFFVSWPNLANHRRSWRGRPNSPLQIWVGGGVARYLSLQFSNNSIEFKYSFVIFMTF